MQIALSTHAPGNSHPRLGPFPLDTLRLLRSLYPFKIFLPTFFEMLKKQPLFRHGSHQHSEALVMLQYTPVTIPIQDIPEIAPCTSIAVATRLYPLHSATRKSKLLFNYLRWDAVGTDAI